MAKWARTEELARHLGVSPRTAEKWRIQGGGPPYSRVRRVVIYDLDHVDRWLAEREQASTSDGPPAGRAAR
jgi:phage terminase Nu1 subunit (DNA packaging protein)